MQVVKKSLVGSNIAFSEEQFDTLSTCIKCLLSKYHKFQYVLSSPNSSPKVVKLLQLIHLDMLVSPDASVNGYQYYVHFKILIIDTPGYNFLRINLVYQYPFFNSRHTLNCKQFVE